MDGEAGTRGDTCEKSKADFSETSRTHSTVREKGRKIIVGYVITVSTEVCSKSCVCPEKGPPFCPDTRGSSTEKMIFES